MEQKNEWGTQLEDRVDQMTDELLGFEYEEKVEEEDDEQTERPFDAEKIRIDQKMLSLKYIKELLEAGSLNLSPGFQRNKVWKDRKQKSLLIESLMLRIPIPAFYFYEDEESNYYVIDGLQRLSTIEDYLNGKFRLSGLQYLQDTCGNKKFNELASKYVNRIYQTQLAVNIIDARTPVKVKYDLFRRINTGGIPLNAQEIRNSTAKPRTREFLKRATKLSSFLAATGGGINDLRMGAQELVLRFISFFRAYNPLTGEVLYEKGDLELFLDEAFEHINHIPDSVLMEYESFFDEAMNKAYALFGEYAFRSFRLADIEEIYKKKLINKSLFTTWSVLLAYEEVSIELLERKRTKALRLLAHEIEFNDEYAKSLSVNTNTTKRVKTRFEVSRRILNEVLANDE